MVSQSQGLPHGAARISPGPCSSERSSSQTQGEELSVYVRVLQSYQQSCSSGRVARRRQYSDKAQGCFTLPTSNLPPEISPTWSLCFSRSCHSQHEHESWLTSPEFPSSSTGKRVPVCASSHPSQSRQMRNSEWQECQFCKTAFWGRQRLFFNIDSIDYVC